ncbi:uncharacterized protein BXZ73DRAFT_46563 [Epithele typhae]|uniref:uncharacterized protein n=1 Tax=Epithele typhae TaxID=378194 RepID=UPI0020085276|nr:uncharacterized protein BXZ73DRAFT_46563 [Epithele typhae]KAH9933158.1 hypothetical protein BXZ73DRAFT_46563 [Epithele typhae]
MSFADPVLFKIPLLLMTAYANFITFTPPNPRTEPEERTKYSSVKYIVRQVRPPWVRALEKTITQSFILFEVATILATYFPLPVAERILPTLAWRPAASALGVRLTPLFLLGAALCAVGGALRLLCYRALGRHFTFELSLRRNHQLVTDGPYAVVRHPSYTALIMVTVGTLLCLVGGGSWLAESGIMHTLVGQLLVAMWAAEVAWIPVVMIMRVDTEDEILRKEFKDEWTAWAQRTPYKLVPGVL